MSILIDNNTKALVYGLTGRYGTAQVKNMLHYGTNIVAGVSAGKGGSSHLDIPICDTAKEAVRDYGANTAIVYIPASIVKNTVLEAIAAGVKLIFIPTEGIPVHDMMILRKVAIENDVWIVGPNSLGIISPGRSLIGSIASEFTKPGNLGVISRSGTLSLEVISFITQGGFGQTTVVSMGGDVVLGRNPVDYLKEYQKDNETKAVVMLGEIGGMKEYEVCDYLPEFTKPLITYIGGQMAKKGKRMGHMGALIGGANQDAKSKSDALKKAGAIVVNTPWDIADAIRGLNLL